MAFIRSKLKGLVMLPHLRELALVVSAYWAYMYTRSLVFNDLGATAFSNATSIISLERSLGFFWEPHWQEWAISSAKALVLFFNWAYIITFWPILLVTGITLYVVDRQRYRFYRNVVLLSFVFAMLGFMLFPLAPPRMMTEQFVDTIKSFGPAFYASREFANFYNPYAAMPSLHFSWTIMFGILFIRTPNKWVRIFGFVYPMMTLLAITVTANHYIMDALGGAVLMLAAYGTLELGFRRRLFIPRLLTYYRGAIMRRGSPSVDTELAKGETNHEVHSRPGKEPSQRPDPDIGPAGRRTRREDGYRLAP